MNQFSFPGRRLGLILVPGALVGSWASLCYGFCRTTTCDPGLEMCQRDADSCVVTGQPLYWPDLCVTFGTEANGSPLRGLDYDVVDATAQRAFQTWVSAECRDGYPSIGIVPKGQIECDQPEFNNDPPSANANVIMFRDDIWPPDKSKTIALTTLTFETSTGEILDADVEINSLGMPLSVSDVEVTNDLQSVLTHEFGHFLGLAHSNDPTATMNANYDRRDLSFRTLSADDTRAICSVYRPGIDLEGCRGAQPRFGFSRYCAQPYDRDGCSIGLAGGTSRPDGALLLLGIGLALGFGARRRA